MSVRLNPTRSIAARGHTAVDDNLRAGNEARFVGSKKQHRMRGVAAVAHEAEWNPRHAGLEQRFDIATGALLGEPRLDHRRMHLTRHHGVYPDAVLGILHRGDARELDHGSLGRGVADLRRAGIAGTGGVSERFIPQAARGYD